MSIRVVVADDSAGVRLAISSAFKKIPGVEVVGTAVDGIDVVGKVLQHRPDLVTIDYVMPNRDGVTAASIIHRHFPDMVLALVSGSDAPQAEAALVAAKNLPIEFIPKPSATTPMGVWAEMYLHPLVSRIEERGTLNREPVRLVAKRGDQAIEAVLIGASTGGPNAVTTVLAALDPSIGVPVFIVQHMPVAFTEVFARSLDDATPWKVAEAFDGALPKPGEAWVAQGDKHMRIVRDVANRLKIQFDEGPREHGCRPAVDVMFRSAAESLGSRCVAAVLTGMGRDGTPGGLELHASGGTLVVQDQATSVVWGMPGSLAQTGVATAVLPLSDVGPWLTERVNAANRRKARV